MNDNCSCHPKPAPRAWTWHHLALAFILGIAVGIIVGRFDCIAANLDGGVSRETEHIA